MKDTWAAIEEWLSKHAPEVLADLQPAASAEAIHSAEATFGTALPAEMASSYGIHDGQRGGASPLMGDWRLLSLDAGGKEWTTIKDLADSGTFEGTESDPDAQVADGWWHRGWLPVASNDSGDFLCVDIEPAPGGTQGQIISFLHADPRRELIAPGFKAWLEAFATDLQSGRATVQEGRIALDSSDDG